MIRPGHSYPENVSGVHLKHVVQVFSLNLGLQVEGRAQADGRNQAEPGELQSPS